MSGGELSSRALQEIQDWRAIKELRARYCWAVARGDVAAIILMYAGEALFETPGKDGRAIYRGKPAIRAYLASTTLPGKVFVRTHDDILFVDGDEAKGSCVTEAFTHIPGYERISGYYHDRLRKIENRWYFTERRFYSYYPTFERSGLSFDEAPETAAS